jgi:hypothetical protein
MGDSTCDSRERGQERAEEARAWWVAGGRGGGPEVAAELAARPGAEGLTIGGEGGCWPS